VGRSCPRPALLGDVHLVQLRGTVRSGGPADRNDIISGPRQGPVRGPRRPLIGISGRLRSDRGRYDASALDKQVEASFLPIGLDWCSETTW
jgi:hypothetical protein